MAKIIPLVAAVVVVVAVLITFGDAITGQLTARPETNLTKAADIMEQLGPSGASGFFDESYSCLADKALLGMSGISSAVVLGNTVSLGNFSQPDHAWIMVTEEEGMAFGNNRRPVSRQQNPLYYQGFSFHDDSRLVEYIRLRERYSTISERIAFRESEFADCTSELQEMIEKFNTEYGGKKISEQSASAHADVHEKMGECGAIHAVVESDRAELSYIENSMNNILSSTQML